MARVFFDTRINIDSDAISSATAYSLKQSDSGKTFIVTGAAQAVTLIPVADLQKGWNCKFINGTGTIGDKTLAAGSAIIHGPIKDGGDEVGPSVGPADGEEVGPLLGLAEGSELGPPLGLTEGSELGPPLGPAEGPELGLAEGTELGPSLGPPLGSELGAELGSVLGDSLGLELGAELGPDEGSELGAELGAAVSVGVSEGAELGK